jgi:hypothetical protein
LKLKRLLAELYVLRITLTAPIGAAKPSTT